MSETETAIEKFRGPLRPDCDEIMQPNGAEVAVVAACTQQNYQRVGLLRNKLKEAEVRWPKLLKDDPHKPPSQCEGAEGIYFFAYQALERARKIVNDGLGWISPRRQACDDWIRACDAHFQAELRKKQEAEDKVRRDAEAAAERARLAEESKRLEAQRKEQEAERARLAAANAKTAAERRKAEEMMRAAQEAQCKLEAEQAKLRADQESREREADAAANRMSAAFDTAAKLAKGPEGMVKVKKFIPTVTDKATFVKWVCRTENWQLVDVAQGTLTKHVNVLAGKSLPDGVSVRREDILRIK